MVFLPGPTFIATRLPVVLLPAGVTYVALRAIERLDLVKFPLSPSIQVLLIVLSVPVTFVASLYGRYWSQRSRAKANGAILAPTIPYKVPGGLDVTAQFQYDIKNAYLAQTVLGYTKEFGQTFTLYISFDRSIITMEPEYIKAILATDFNNFEKGPGFRDHFKGLLGTGVFNSDGEMWKFHRGITRPYFSKDRISHFEIFNRHAEDVIALAKERLRAGFPIDFQDLTGRFTLDSATEFLFGQDLQSLAAGLPYPASSPRAAENAFAANSPANRFFVAFQEAQHASLKTRFVIDGFLKPLITEAIRRRKEGGKAKEKEEDEMNESLLEHLTKVTDDYSVIKDETLNIMLAGRDTTSSTLTFCIYMLSQHPDVMQRLREEILSVVGSNRGPTIDEVRQMKYLRAVINETLRLFPPVTAIKDTVWQPQGTGQKRFFIPAGTRCIYSVYLMHRRTDLWGPDALEFDPDRFIDDRLGKYITRNPFIFLPFNAGPRICLGQQFAYNEVSFMLVRLLQAFSAVELAPEGHPEGTLPPAQWKTLGGRAAVEKIRPNSHLTLYSDGGLWLRLKEAEN
ncbi:hypothetical protein EVG20_g7724 [Dentipellis fragilis]|uniref:Cytochrome P450 n=1 Tax=Dentipellis fragilis TaxID=205917 RepID=A0A4Y9YCJ9_9AGAM|nr:hypothetical protein EVG20_g7724 [Dentipellis fragilis]